MNRVEKRSMLNMSSLVLRKAMLDASEGSSPLSRHVLLTEEPRRLRVPEDLGTPDTWATNYVLRRRPRLRWRPVSSEV